MSVMASTANEKKDGKVRKSAKITSQSLEYVNATKKGKAPTRRETQRHTTSTVAARAKKTKPQNSKPHPIAKKKAARPVNTSADSEQLHDRLELFDGSLQSLFTEGVRVGHVDGDQVANALAALDASEEEGERYYALLSDAGVDLEDEEIAESAGLTVKELENAAEDASQDSARLQDGIRLYFDDIRRVPLLTPIEESIVAKKKELWAAKLEADKSGRSIQEVWEAWREAFLEHLPEYIENGLVNLDEWPALIHAAEDLGRRRRQAAEAQMGKSRNPLTKTTFNRMKKYGFLGETKQEAQAVKLHLANVLIHPEGQCPPVSKTAVLPPGFEKIDREDPRLPKATPAEIAKSRQAFDHMWKANLRLVVSIATKYRSHGLPLMDLCQEGNIGLGRAIEKFNHRKGYKLSTYATWWIKQQIARALAYQLRTIRVPVHKTEELNRYKRAVTRLSAKLGRDPTLDEISEYLEVKKEDIEALRTLSQETISLNMGVGDDDASELGELVSDDKAINPEEQILQSSLSAALQAAIERLPMRKQKILKLRHELGGESVRTLEDVADKLGETREKVRNLENEILQQLAEDPELQAIAQMLD